MTDARRIRVLMVIGQYHPIIGGAENQTQGLAGALTAKGANVSVLTARRPASARARELVDGIPVERVQSLRVPKLGKYLELAAFARALKRLAPAADIIHAHQGLAPAALAVKIGHAAGVPVVVKIGNSAERFDLDILRASYAIGRSLAGLVPKADALIALNPRMGEQLREAGAPADRIHRIPNGVDAQRFRPLASDRERGELRQKLGLPARDLVLFVGNLTTKKNVATLLDAWPAVLARHPAAHLILLGDGPEKRALIERADGLGLHDGVSFLGEREAPEEYLRMARVFVLPSLVEGMANALLEAMASGLPVAASNVPGNADLVRDGETGRLVDPRDPAALADALLQFLTSPDRAREAGARARAIIESEYAMDKIADRYLALYEELRAGASPAVAGEAPPARMRAV